LLAVLGYVAVAGLLACAAVAGLAALGRRGRMTDEEYEARLGRQSPLGNALLDVQALLEPDREPYRKARQEIRTEVDGSGEPP
jgi:hypothetical protein